MSVLTHSHDEMIKEELDKIEANYEEMRKVLTDKLESGNYENKQVIEDRISYLDKMHKIASGRHPENLKDDDNVLTRYGQAIYDKHQAKIQEMRDSGMSEEEINDAIAREKAWEKEYWYFRYMKDPSKIVPHEKQKAVETDMDTYNAISKMMGKDSDEDEDEESEFEEDYEDGEESGDNEGYEEE